MAATIKNKKTLSSSPYHIQQFQMSSMTSSLSETITHGIASGIPFYVSRNVTTRPTDGSAVDIEFESTSTANDTVTLKVYSSSGDLTGAVIDVQLWFLDVADQDQGSFDQFS